MSLLNRVTKTAPPLPSRVYMYAPEKFGKTSWAAYAPDPIFVMTEGETGLLSLIESGRVPETPHFPEDCKTWDELNRVMEAILRDEHKYRTLVLDTANGAERLLSTYVCNVEFDGRMTGKEGYGSYSKGDLACVPHWTNFLRLLDEIRVRRKMLIVLLAHAKVKTVNNPEGPDYDQSRPDGIDKLWTLTHKWADIITAGTFDIAVKDDKVKAVHGRVLRTTSSAAVVAGNRYGLPEIIKCGNDARSAWKAFQDAVVKAKSPGRQQQPPPPPASPPPSNDGSQQPPSPPPASPTASQPARQREPGEDDPYDQPDEQPSAQPTEAPRNPARISGDEVLDLLKVLHAANLAWPEAAAEFYPGRPAFPITELSRDAAVELKAAIAKRPRKGAAKKMSETVAA